MNTPQQRRSQETTRRILEAARALLRERTLDEISVAQIAERAAVSVGGFYARFNNKEDVVGHLCDEAFLADFVAEVEADLAPARWADARIPDVLELYLGRAVTLFREQRGLLREIARLSRTSADRAFRTRIERFNVDTHHALRTVLLAHASEIRHPDPALAVDLGGLMVFAVMREVIFFGDLRPDLPAVDDARLTGELTRMFLRYLDAAPSRTDQRRRRGR